MRNRNLVVLSLALAVMFFGLGRHFAERRAHSAGGASAVQPDARASLESPLPLGSDFPDLTLEDREGRVVPLSSLRDGRGVYLLALSSSCGGCESEIERWQKGFDRLAADVAVVGVIPESFAALDGRWSEAELPFPLYRDREEALQAAGVHAVPSGFGLDERGRVVVAHYGIQSMPGDRLEEFRERLATARDLRFSLPRAARRD